MDLFLLNLFCVLALIILALSYFLVLKQPDLEKVSAYECGFDPFSDARGRLM